MKAIRLREKAIRARPLQEIPLTNVQTKTLLTASIGKITARTRKLTRIKIRKIRKTRKRSTNRPKKREENREPVGAEGNQRRRKPKTLIRNGKSNHQSSPTSKNQQKLKIPTLWRRLKKRYDYVILIADTLRTELNSLLMRK